LDPERIEVDYNERSTMNITWGVVLTLLSLIGWAGQVITALSPRTGTKLGLAEPESMVDPAFAADVRAEAIWDIFVLWTLPVAGILLILNHSWWAYFGLVGGGMYLYFAGRGILQRLIMKRRGFRIGTPTNVKLAYVFCSLWGVAAVVTIALAVTALPLR
jgi:hypothetical protein